MSPTDLKSLAWPALLTRLDGVREPSVQAEIDRRYESFTYRDIKADIPELSRLNRGTKPSAAAARRALEEAFSRAPISDSLRWLADADAALKSLIWERLTARIEAADDERKASYLNWSSQVLAESSDPLAARLAAIEFLGKLPRQAGVKALVQGLRLKEASLRLACADALRKMTGEKYGPRPGDNEAALAEAIQQWETWLGNRRE